MHGGMGQTEQTAVTADTALLLGMKKTPLCNTYSVHTAVILGRAV
jgi:hypothetical protein